MSKYIDLAKKIKALAENGVDGEKHNAEKLLNDLMQKHNISIEDLEDEKIEMFYFKIKNYKHDLEFKILHQIAGLNGLKTYGRFPERLIREWKLTGNYGIKCSKVKYLEIKAMFDFYCDSMAKRLDEFFYAFCIKNNLLIPAVKNESDEKPSKDEVEKYKKALKISENLDSDMFFKQLENN